MGKQLRWPWLVLLAVLVLGLSSGLVQAQGWDGIAGATGAGTALVGPDEVHEGDFRATGDRVTVEGTVTGDLLAAAGSVSVPGTVEGDVLSAGGNINVTGRVGDDVRAMGGNVTVDGEIGKNVSLMGGNLQLLPGAEIGGSVMLLGGQLDSQADVGRDLWAGGDLLRVGGTVGGDVETQAEEVQLLPGAVVEGDLLIRPGTEVVLADDAVLEGEVVEQEPRETVAPPDLEDIRGALAPLRWLGRTIGFLGSVVVGAVLLALAPRPTVNTADHLRRRPLITFLWGLLALVGIPAVVLVLAMTVIGLPLGVLLGVYYLALLFLSRLFVGLWVGRLILKPQAGSFWAFLLGFFIISLLCALPFVGWAINFLVVLGGLGALALTHADLYRELRDNRITVGNGPGGPGGSGGPGQPGGHAPGDGSQADASVRPPAGSTAAESVPGGAGSNDAGEGDVSGGPSGEENDPEESRREQGG